MAGRPKYHNDLAVLEQKGPEEVEELLERGLPIVEVCRQLGVGKRALYSWLEERQNAGLLSRARARAADQLAAETLAIADQADEDSVNQARLRIQTRQWLAGKWNPQNYGDKSAQVTINIGDLHLAALKQARSVTPIQEHDSNVVDVTPIEPDLPASPAG